MDATCKVQDNIHVFRLVHNMCPEFWVHITLLEGFYAIISLRRLAMKVIDLTHTIKENMPVYPGTDTPKLMPANTYEKDGFKETLMQVYTHTGTHMDPPAHLYAGRTTLDQFPPDQFIGKALVIDCRDLNEGEPITMDLIRIHGSKAEEADFLLFNLG